MTIDVVTLETNHHFHGNPILEQHKLRYRSIIKRQSWDIPVIRDIEYDEYDNPATVYLVWRDHDGIARGVSRLYPTDRPFMLKEHFQHLVTDCALPIGKDVFEGSRFCIDKSLPIEARKRVAQELILAYLEHGLNVGIKQYIGIMYPIYWKHLFLDVGWQPTWFGEPIKTPDGKKSRAGGVVVSREALEDARSITGIDQNVITYGMEQNVEHLFAA